MYRGVYSRAMCTIGPCVHWCVQYDHVDIGVYSRAMCTVVCVYSRTMCTVGFTVGPCVYSRTICSVVCTVGPYVQ